MVCKAGAACPACTWCGMLGFTGEDPSLGRSGKDQGGLSSVSREVLLALAGQIPPKSHTVKFPHWLIKASLK